VTKRIKDEGRTRPADEQVYIPPAVLLRYCTRQRRSLIG